MKGRLSVSFKMVAVLALFFWYGLLLYRNAFAFSVDPARIELEIAAGRQKGVMVSIDNRESQEPLHIKIYPQDIVYQPNGEYEYPAAGTTAWSCANWIKVTPSEIDIPAGKKASVRVSVTVPGGIKGGYYSMLFFESGTSYTAQGLGINFRIGALVGVSVANTQERMAELADFSFKAPNEIEVDIRNKGNVLIRPKGKIKIQDVSGKAKAKQVDFNLHAQSILPNTSRKFSIELDQPLLKGSYKIRAEIDYGTKKLLIGELPVDLK